jgi:hypothetical protein
MTNVDITPRTTSPVATATANAAKTGLKVIAISILATLTVIVVLAVLVRTELGL